VTQPFLLKQKSLGKKCPLFFAAAKKAWGKIPHKPDSIRKGNRGAATPPTYFFQFFSHDEVCFFGRKCPRDSEKQSLQTKKQFKANFQAFSLHNLYISKRLFDTQVIPSWRIS
jgi:hypothetical protein